MTNTRAVWQSLCALLALAIPCGAEWTYVGDYVAPYELRGNTVRFRSANAVVTLQVCAEDIFRIRMSPSGEFKGNEPWVVIRYDWPPCKFTVRDRGKYVEVKTERLIVRVGKSPLRLSMYDLAGKRVNEDAPGGGMGFDGEAVVCRKTMTATDHFFGLGETYGPSDFRGREAELWLTEHETPVPLFMGTDGYGIFFHNFWKTRFDFREDPYQFSAPGGGELDYYFLYGPSFKHVLDLYTRITGKSPMPPKWVLGVVVHAFSSARPDQRPGQEGVLRYVKAARTEKDWPLDCVKIHAGGCRQNVWASPSLNWPAFRNWGSFPAVDRLVEQLHGMHCHVIWWQSPGVMPECKEMYAEGIKHGYFIMKDGKVWNGSLGSRHFGALIDFCNPEARKWLAGYVDFLIDLDSDGQAVDHGEEVRGTMYSPYKNPYNGTLTGQEYHNIYAMLYNQAYWEAFQARNPNRRSSHSGRSAGPGCQRHPVFGAQDSNEVGKPIHGEMMSAINLGLSGVPFKTYTDRYSRDEDFSHPVRAAQYVFLGACGQRSNILWTDYERADRNYRFYGKLRYRMIPYLYSYVRETTQTGVPMMRALVLEYQDDPKTYGVYGQYLLGEGLLLAPFWRDDELQRQIYLPEGEWIDFWDDTRHRGGTTIDYTANSIDRVPIFVKAGTILPLAPADQRYVDEKSGPLTVEVYPKGTSSFDLYEDDGISYDCDRGVYAVTTFSCVESEQGLHITKSAPRGKYRLPARDHVFRVHTHPAAAKVRHDGRAMPRLASRAEWNAAREGWFQEEGGTVLQIKVPGKTAEPVSLAVDAE